MFKTILSYRCIVTTNVLWLILTVPWVGLQCVISVFPDHTHLLLFFTKWLLEENEAVKESSPLCSVLANICVGPYFTTDHKYEIGQMQLQYCRFENVHVIFICEFV